MIWPSPTNLCPWASPPLNTPSPDLSQSIGEQPERAQGARSVVAWEVYVFVTKVTGSRVS